RDQPAPRLSRLQLGASRGSRLPYRPESGMRFWNDPRWGRSNSASMGNGPADEPTGRIAMMRSNLPARGAAALLAALLVAFGAAAQDGGDREAASQPAEPPATEGTEPDAAEPPGRGADPDDVFVPSEEIGADEEVTFPVDI